ncbi:putative DNA polymerase kappa [Leishmania major strain Friedlin]|uniref:DNA polymerase kappa n=1 Tax=Leishmania major TaxID=5664 RepID=Q4Q8C3_LEIMA|nr:putative DNA polymerase kappa [Leishmania major strain Friedlin]CAG9577252.1 DNA_polymerase_kappa_-_putative [Leishmania major strain Friedlin]CAJ05438.1 putative DNA polymerase kappa [Leishmania major strain Friedlin]|eukprot:XP_001684425.1 putative DNA polymerase kappa [Leishmania major strain Friedlin]
MFYAAVEEKLDPSLRERPFAVGSYAMLTPSNYIARAYGVRSGMPGFIAKKLCPSLWIRPPHFDLYRREAAEVRVMGALYDPHYVAVGLDELTMDVTDYLRAHQDRSAQDVCAEFRRRVEAATQLTCSGGIAHTAAFAKLASNVNKPNGQHILTLRTREEVLAHVRDMPVRDVPGIGFATEQRLHALGVVTCKDFLARKAELCYLFREKTFAFLPLGGPRTRAHPRRSLQRGARSRRGTAERGGGNEAQLCGTFEITSSSCIGQSIALCAQGGRSRSPCAEVDWEVCHPGARCA